MGFEPLETRCLLAVYTVLNALDAGDDSLRWAIEQANANPGADEIHFNIGGGGAHTISLDSPLPAIVETVTLDGATQPGYAGAPLIQIDGGAGPVPGAPGLLLHSHEGSTVRGLVVSHFEEYGIFILLGGSHAIEGNYIGTDLTGTVAAGNLGGIGIFSSSNNRIGSDGDGVHDANERNVIAASTGDSFSGRGISFSTWGAGDPVSANNVVAGNYIGTDVTGTIALGNHVGIAGGGAGTIIGTDGTGDSVAKRNLISGNRASGIEGGFGMTIAGNYIGTDASGQVALGNGSESGGPGIALNFGSSNNIVGSNGDGVGDEFEGNLISGNNGEGVLIQGDAVHNVVAGNLIGLAADGVTEIASGGNAGVFLQGAGAGNRIGTNSDGVADELERNVIAAGFTSIRIDGGNGGNRIAGNYINTTNHGNQLSGSGRGGILILGSADNVIGTNGDGVRDAVERNVVASGGGWAIQIALSESTGNVVAGNYVGVAASGTTGLGAAAGVLITSGASDNRVGTDGNGVADEAERNVISGHAFAGVALTGGAHHNIVAGNSLGTDAVGSLPIPNLDAIHIGGGAFSNLIGGESPASANRISSNSQNGVSVEDFGLVGTAGNSILGNSIYSNGNLGIDLNADPFSPGEPDLNDALDADEGANDLQNFPALASASSLGASVTIAGALHSTPNAAFRVEFFANSALHSSSYGEGETYLGFASVATDGSGNGHFNVTLPASVPVGAFVTATATNAGGSTSEFSLGVPVVSGNNAPTAGVAGPATGVRYQPRSFVVTASDDAADAALGFTYEIDWGDGHTTVVSPTPGNGAGVSVDHEYATTGSFVVSVAAIDAQGAASPAATATMAIAAAAVQGSDLIVGGASGDDVISYSRVNNSVKAYINGQWLGPFTVPGRVIVYGGDGNDLLDGGNGNDVLVGGKGNDVLVGGNGDDQLDGGDGKDQLDGGNGNDVVAGGNGNDVLLGGNGDDLLDGGDGDDIITGGNGADVLYGGAGNDVMSGGNGDDQLFGGEGIDELVGDNGNDVLIGGAGDDSIDGGNGNDLMIGGGGGDAFVGGNGEDLLVAGWTHFDANAEALDAIMAEWTSSRSFAARVANLSGTGSGSNWTNRANGNSFLVANPGGPHDVTVFDDDGSDSLVGGLGRDWLFANFTGAGVHDLVSGNELQDLAVDLALLAP